jgi:N-methylhydantoinase A/oxoprolinase/acetone carboxylase beta subunit
VIRAGTLAPEDGVAGPAIIEQATTTIVVPPNLSGRMTTAGSFLVELDTTDG